MSRAKSLINMMEGVDLGKNEKKVMSEYLQSLFQSQGSLGLCLIENEIIPFMDSALHKLRENSMKNQEATAFLKELESIKENLETHIAQCKQFMERTDKETRRLMEMGIKPEGVEDDAKCLAVEEDAQKGGINLIIDLDFTGLIPDKEKIENIFRREKEQFLLNLDQKFKELGLNKKEGFQITEGGTGDAKQRASAVARALAGWKEADLKNLVISVDGKKNVPGLIKKAIKAVNDDGLLDKSAFGLRDLKAGALIQLKK